jgi:PDZ domain
MKAPCLVCWLIVGALLHGMPVSLSAQETQPFPQSAPDSAPAPLDTRQGRTVGAPQILEIPTQELAPPTTAAPQPWELPPAHERALGIGDPNDDGLRPEATMPAMVKRNYLGVLYATAEDGPQGVKVLDVVQESPAARAGFQGVNVPGTQSNDLLKAAIVVLAMSPVGAFAIPLAIAHDIYTSRQSPGDLIVAVNDRPVHDAQEFSEEMRRYQPGDTVSFAVMRSGKPLQIAVKLEEEPL